MTRLSLIIPARDAEPYIGQTLKSLERNVGSDDEVVVVNDASVDTTAEIVDSYRRHIPGLELVHNRKPHGLAGARNDGLDVAGGRYIAFLDADDWLAPGTLDQMIDGIEALDVDFVRVDHVQVFGERRVVVRAPEARRGRRLDPRTSIMPDDKSTMVDYPYAWAGIFHCRLLENSLLRFDEGLHTAEDRPWIWRLHRLAASYAVLPVLGHLYRRHVEGSLTQIGDERQLDYIRSFDIVLHEVAGDENAQHIMPKAVRSYCSVMMNHLHQENRLTPEVRGEHRRQARAALKRIDEAVLLPVLSGMGSRGRALRRLRSGRPLVTTPK